MTAKQFHCLKDTWDPKCQIQGCNSKNVKDMHPSKASAETRCELQLSSLSVRTLTICTSFFGSGTMDVYTEYIRTRQHKVESQPRILAHCWLCRYILAIWPGSTAELLVGRFTKTRCRLTLSPMNKAGKLVHSTQNSSHPWL